MKVGTVFKERGLLKKHERFKLVKKVGKAGDLIKSHNHPEALVLFTVVKGSIRVFLNEEEFVLRSGELLHFDGANFINAEFLSEAEVFITLINK